MDLFPQNAGFGSEAAMKEASDARYLTKQIPLCSIRFRFTAILVHIHVSMILLLQSVMTENVEKQSAVRSSSWWPGFFFPQRAVFQIMALILCMMWMVRSSHCIGLCLQKIVKLIYDLILNSLRVFFIGLLRLPARLYQTIYGKMWQNTVSVMCAKTFLL